MSGTRPGVGDAKLQISCSIFLIVFFSFTFCVVQCEDTPGKKDPTNEVPPINHNSTDAKNETKKPLTSSPNANVDVKKDEKKDESKDQEKNTNANINAEQIVPAVPAPAVKTNETDKSSESNEEKKLPPQVTKKPTENEKGDNDKTNEVENSDGDSAKSTDKPDTSETDSEKSQTDKTDASSAVSGADDHSESEKSSTSEEKKTDTDHVDKDESGDVTNGKKDSDSDKKNSVSDKKDTDSDNEVPAIATNKTDETASESNAGKSTDSNHSQHSDSTPNLTSPSLSDQSVKTNQEPQEFFRTLKPRINSGNDHNFSFFRLFIVTSVFFVALYVGYYYRHRIKRHFGYNNNEIYYHPLRTMQHNAVD